MSDHQVVLTLRVSERLLERLQVIADRPCGARSRSEAARQALELGLERMETEPSVLSPSVLSPSVLPPSVLPVAVDRRDVWLEGEVTSLKARILRIEQTLRKGAP